MYSALRVIRFLLNFCFVFFCDEAKNKILALVIIPYNFETECVGTGLRMFSFRLAI